MKQILTLALSVALITSSCSKKDDAPSQPQTPLHEILDAKYIKVSGSNELTVDYNAYNPNKEIDKQVLQAAQKAIAAPYNYDRIYVAGKNITSQFKKGSNVAPASYRLTTGSTYYNQASTEKPWRGKILIKKTNNAVSKADFENGVSINVSAVNTGDQASIISKTVTDNLIIVTFALTTAAPNLSKAVNFQVQSNVAVEYTVKYDIEYAFNGATRVDASIPASNTQPTISGTGSNTQLSGQLHANGAKDALLEYVATWYWTQYVIPEIQ